MRGLVDGNQSGIECQKASPEGFPCGIWRELAKSVRVIAAFSLVILVGIAAASAQTLPPAGQSLISPSAPGSTALNTPSQYTFMFRPPSATNWVNWGTIVFEDPTLSANGTGTSQNTCNITVNAVEVQIFDSTGSSQNLYPGQLYKTLAQRTNNYCWFLDESHLAISVDSATNTLTATVWFAFNPTQAYFQSQHGYMGMNWATTQSSGDYHSIGPGDQGFYPVGIGPGFTLSPATGNVSVSQGSTSSATAFTIASVK